jgi:enterochelin esterase-like enzyme
MDSGIVTSAEPPLAYLIYLPPCYEETNRRYPVLYLLHGQTYAADQWLRLGAVTTLDELIRSGEAQPFFIVFPEDKYWYTESGSGFGERVVEALIPHIDQTYRTLPDRDQRAIGGLSRGGGWALRLGMSRWDLFSVIGLHAPAALQQDGSRLEKWLKAIPPASHPVIYLDIGDNDPELGNAEQMETLFNTYSIPHEWHLFSGAHTEEYWSAHVPEYLAWYAGQWNNR